MTQEKQKDPKQRQSSSQRDTWCPHFPFCTPQLGASTGESSYTTGNPLNLWLFLSGKLSLTTKKKKTKPQAKSTQFLFCFSNAYIICNKCKKTLAKTHSPHTAILALSHPRQNPWSLAYLCGISPCSLCMCWDPNVLLQGAPAVNEEVLEQRVSAVTQIGGWLFSHAEE